VIRFSVESNGGAIIGEGYMDSNAPANGAIIQGNVGIGTTQPVAKIHSKATGNTPSFFAEGGYDFGVKGDNNIQIGHYNTASDTFNTRIHVNTSGNVGIGTSDPQSKLAVNGTINAKEVKVTYSGWSDYVFDENYDLPAIEKVESYLIANKHLPDIPSAREVERKGIAVSGMLAMQMQKIEELTLYIIEQNRKIKKLEEQMANLTGCDDSN